MHGLVVDMWDRSYANRFIFMVSLDLPSIRFQQFPRMGASFLSSEGNYFHELQQNEPSIL